MIKQEVERLSKIYGDVFKQHLNEAGDFLTFVSEYYKNKDSLTIMEIGICYGANLCCMGNALSLLGKKVKAIGLDLPNIDLWGGHPINPKEQIKRGNPKFNYEIIIGDSHKEESLEEVKKYVSTVDILFIDGDHSKEGALKDFEMYKVLVPIGGLIAFHDTKFYAPWPHCEVWKIWDELKVKYNSHDFSYNPNYGIGVIEYR